MTRTRIREIAPGLALVACCSLVPIGARSLLAEGYSAVSVQAGMFVGAAAAGLLAACFRRETAPRKEHRGRIALLLLAGCCASLGYFQVVFHLGAADADWIEGAILTVLLVLIA